MTRPLRQTLLSERRIEHGFGVRGCPELPDVRRPRQVHGARVASAEECETPGSVEADAVWSAQPGVAVGVVTADCVPILAACEDGRAVAAIHAGWRGLAAGVIEAGVAALARAGTRRVIAAIGPHIGPCCYEVDAPVLSALAGRYADVLDAASVASRPGHARLDLGLLARGALLACGLEADRIGSLEAACTACDSRRFHSYRRDGARAGRLLHFVRARPVRLDTAAGGP